jgi:hypothetical protein
MFSRAFQTITKKQSLSANSWKIFSQRKYYISKLENNAGRDTRLDPGFMLAADKLAGPRLELYRRRGPPILTQEEIMARTKMMDNSKATEYVAALCHMGDGGLVKYDSECFTAANAAEAAERARK